MALIYRDSRDKDQRFSGGKGVRGARVSDAMLGVEPRWDSLHSDPRFADLSADGPPAVDLEITVQIKLHPPRRMSMLW